MVVRVLSVSFSFSPLHSIPYSSSRLLYHNGTIPIAKTARLYVKENSITWKSDLTKRRVSKEKRAGNFVNALLLDSVAFKCHCNVFVRSLHYIYAKILEGKGMKKNIPSKADYMSHSPIESWSSCLKMRESLILIHATSHSFERFQLRCPGSFSNSFDSLVLLDRERRTDYTTIQQTTKHTRIRCGWSTLSTEDRRECRRM